MQGRRREKIALLNHAIQSNPDVVPPQDKQAATRFANHPQRTPWKAKSRFAENQSQHHVQRSLLRHAEADPPSWQPWKSQ
jgi:hypothetical protein